MNCTVHGLSIKCKCEKGVSLLYDEYIESKNDVMTRCQLCGTKYTREVKEIPGGIAIYVFEVKEDKNEAE